LKLLEQFAGLNPTAPENAMKLWQPDLSSALLATCACCEKGQGHGHPRGERPFCLLGSAGLVEGERAGETAGYSTVPGWS